MRGKGMAERMTGHALGHTGFNRGPAHGALDGAFMEVVSSFAGRSIAPAARRREDPLPGPFARDTRQLPRQRVGQPNLAEAEPQVRLVKRVRGGELLANRIGEGLRQHRRPVAAPFRITDQKLPACKIDVLDAETQRLEEP